MSVGRKAGKGFISFLYRNLMEKLIGMVAMIVLARELSPYDFGLVSITEVVLSLISVFGTTGLAEYLLAYKDDDQDEIFKAAFWLNMCLTICIIVVFLFVAPFWAAYQKDERIWNLSLLAAGIFFFSQLQGIAKTRLSKQLEFEKQVKVQAPFILLIALGKIISVYAGLGVYSLVIPTLICQPFITIFLYRAAGMIPGTRLYSHRWREIFSFSRHLIGSSILGRIVDQSDKIILGKVLGLEKLGIYSIAMQLADLVTSQFVMVSNNVLSSVLPKYVTDKHTLYGHYIQFLKTFSFIMFPVLGVMLVGARPIIELLYGAKWQEAVLPAQILIIYAMFRVVTSSYGSVMNSLHLTKQSFRINLAYAPFHIAGSYLGALTGVAGVATSLVLVKTIFLNFSIRQMMNALAKPLQRWYRDMMPFFTVTYLIIAGIIVLNYFFGISGYLHPLAHICIITTEFFVLYYILFRLFFGNQLKTISGFLSETLPKSQMVFNFLFRI
jgi:PST family polysaccharide transporter/lipopolysaccharide exporter